MAGSWELPRYGTCAIGILHVDNVTLAWSLGLRNLELPGGGAIIPATGMPYDMGRNSIVQQSLDAGADWVFFLDSDVIPPRDAIRRLMDHNAPIVSGAYCRRSPPHAIPVAIKGGHWVTELPDKGLLEVDLVGAGCLLVHNSVFRRMPPQKPGKHWFWWGVDSKGLPGEDPEMCVSEDFSFCRHAKRTLGIPTLLDASLRCRHVGHSQFEYRSMGPLDTRVLT